jgi:HD-GYP domain-containing protein (c-di-GMP phosphodiesterase class II)
MLAGQIERVAGRLPPRDGNEWADEDVEVDEVTGSADGAGEPLVGNVDSRRWLEQMTSGLGPMRRALDVPDLYAQLAHASAVSLASDACVVSLFDEERRILRDVAGSAPGDANLGIVVEEYAIDDFPVTREVLEGCGCVEISASDSNADETERGLLQHLNFARVLICSFAMDDHESTKGTIEIYRRADRPFRADDFRRIEALASVASGVLARIQLSERLQENFAKTIEALTSAVEARHAETQAHTQRIRDTALALADAMKLPPDIRRRVQLGAILHDVGKIGIPDAILLKPGPLDEAELTMMRAHPDIGTKLLSGIDFLQPALSVVRHHHERWDGTGYPEGLKGEEIPVEARIVAICDAFDALTSDRPYRPAISVDAACDEISRSAGTHFDPELTTLLLSIVKSMGTEDLENRFVRFAD